MNNRQGKTVGFTLLEVLIALAILAISSLAVIRQNSQSIVHQQQLQLKTNALIAAENEIAVLQLLPQWPSSGVLTSSIDLAGEQWHIKTTISPTADKDLRKIEVAVSVNTTRAQNNAKPLLSLTSYRGRY